jgi:hypothetical protein
MPPWKAPDSTRDIEAFQAALTPMRLPADVVEYWQRADPRTLPVEPYPRFTNPEFSHESWLEARESFASHQPLTLVFVGYESHACMSVELDVGEIEGGALFEGFISSPDFGFIRRFNALGDWLHYIATLLDKGLYSHTEGRRDPSLLVPDPDRWQEEEAMRPIPEEHPAHRATLRYGGYFRDWPEHWQQANRPYAKSSP